MKYFSLLFATALLQLTIFAQPDYQVTQKGMYYKIVPMGGNTPITPNSVVRFYIEQRVNDSIIFSSFGKGLSVVSLKKTNNIDEHADLFKKMRSGDSLVTLNLANDLLKNTELVLPDFIHAGDSLYQCIRIVDVFASDKAFEIFTAQEKSRKLLADQKIIEAFLKQHKIAAKKTNTGCYIQTLKKGIGPFVTKVGSKVAVRYTGKTLAGQFFDGNEVPGEQKPLLEFETGKGLMIAGFEEAVVSLQKGGRCRIYLPSIYAYGEAGSGDLIGPNEVLVFDVELVKVVLPKKVGPKKK